MSAIEMLVRQAGHRDAWLRDVAHRLEKDGRFSATWLVGSLADGSADGLSDIDFVVVIDDRYAEAIVARPTDEVARLGQTVWLDEVPSNAPLGGAYVSAGFQSSPLPIGVDWYWQPFRHAVLPTDAHLVFQRGSIPLANPPASFAELMSRRPPPPGVHQGHVTHTDLDRVAFFWAMVPVAAKYGARGWDEKAGRILDGLEEQIDMVGAAAPTHHAPVAVRPSLQRLRLLIDRMDQFTPMLRARGIPAPDTSYAFAIVRLAEGLKEEGWRGSTAGRQNEAGDDS